MQSTWKIIAQFAAFIAVVCAMICLGCLGMCKQEIAPKNSGTKRLSRVAAEGFSYRVSKEAYPRIICDSCKTGKMKAGIFSLGAFNTIEFTNLVVNIPQNFQLEGVNKINPAGIHESFKSDNKCGKNRIETSLEKIGLSSIIKMSGWKGGMSFHGFTINGLTINKMNGEKLEPVFSALKMYNRGKTVILKNVILHENGSDRKIPSANLVLSNKPLMQWHDGCIYLENLLKN